MYHSQPLKRLAILVPCLALPLVLSGCAFSSIERLFNNPQEEEMIAIAENICPDADSPEGECQWWVSGTENGAVRRPLGITADAIEYYDGLIQARNHNTVQSLLSNAAFSYTAEVFSAPQYTVGDQEFEDVYVVQMELTYGISAGFYAGYGFSMTRIVVLSSEGTPLLLVDSDLDEWII